MVRGLWCRTQTFLLRRRGEKPHRYAYDAFAEMPTLPPYATGDAREDFRRTAHAVVEPVWAVGGRSAYGVGRNGNADD